MKKLLTILCLCLSFSLFGCSQNKILRFQAYEETLEDSDGEVFYEDSENVNAFLEIDVKNNMVTFEFNNTTYTGKIIDCTYYEDTENTACYVDWDVQPPVVGDYTVNTNIIVYNQEYSHILLAFYLEYDIANYYYFTPVQ